MSYTGHFFLDPAGVHDIDESHAEDHEDDCWGFGRRMFSSVLSLWPTANPILMLMQILMRRMK